MKKQKETIEQIVEVDDSIPELSVLDYEFGVEHASALASLLTAAIVGNSKELLLRAIQEATSQCENDISCFEDDYAHGVDDSLTTELKSSRNLLSIFSGVQFSLENLA